jgi:tetratricopeptide (TPR) repeat protein
LAWPAEISARQRWIATAVLISAIFLVLLIQFRSFREVSTTTQNNTALINAGYENTLPFLPYLLTSVKAYSSYYLWRLWLPIELSVDPEIAPVPSIVTVGFAAASMTLMAAAGGILWFRLRRPLVAVGLALILTSPLSAYCLFPLADVVAEHRAYVAILGSALIIGDIVLRSRYASWTSLAILVGYGWLTIERNKVWADEVRLWEDASRKAPEKLRPHLNMGGAYQLRGEADRAIHEYEFVLRRRPDQSTALANLAALYTEQNRLDRAEATLYPAILRHDRFSPIYVGMAVVRIRQGRLLDARSLLEYALTLDPTQSMIHHNLGDMLLQQNNAVGAVNEYQSELQINPDSVITHLHLANAYEVLGLRDKSIEQYRVVARMDPSNSQVQLALRRLK